MPHRHRALLAVPFVLLALLGATAEAGAATLAGSPAVQAGVDSNTAGRAEAFSAVAAASGQITSLSVYVDASATATGPKSQPASRASGKPSRSSNAQRQRITRRPWPTR